eukprot:CAMPEP_0196660466 /NCGR_PEP_ID=MMETSP1086-20130531/39914_1 /TAXON_ID=77921 /ORGANISM="Cyanoptyche  gloeocystis , Strain SAG4.97" /LENGTH=417 /DNA_ID=CAMNT_0041994893 /DNA_START=59 /DNA_END=1309 /DNA_ORIENTATION=-
MTLAETLAAYVDRKAVKTDTDAELQEHLKRIFEEIRIKEESQHPSLSKIPRFYFKKSSNGSDLQALFRSEVKNRYLQKQSQELLDNEEIDKLFNLLRENLTPPEISERINYEDFRRVGAQLPPKCKEFFTARVFLSFERDHLGRIPILPFFNYVMRKVSLSQTRICLSYYDSQGSGFLKEQDLENYVFELIPSLPQLQTVEEVFFPFYVYTAVRKFFFFLDPLRKGQVRIKSLLLSPMLSELFELRQDQMPPEDAATNWFSSQSALRVYEQYLDLDTDHNGLLSPAELQRYGQGTLTPVFVQRVFQEYNTYNGEMDYKTFLNFVLAMENKKTPQGLRYFFQLLDVQKRGYLTIWDVNYFFRDVLRCMREHNYDTVGVEDVKDEIFDMVKPKDELQISLADLESCKVGDTVVSMLIDW